VLTPTIGLLSNPVSPNEDGSKSECIPLNVGAKVRKSFRNNDRKTKKSAQKSPFPGKYVVSGGKRA